MPLERSCDSYVGRSVFVLPIIGFGWCRIPALSATHEAQQPSIGVDPPEPFRVRIVRFHRHEDQIRAATGVVEEEGHALQNRWVGFCVRDGGGSDLHNLTTQATKHNVRLGISEPVIKIGGATVPMAEWIQFGDGDIWSGIAYVAESVDWISAVLERIRRGNTP